MRSVLLLTMILLFAAPAGAQPREADSPGEVGVARAEEPDPTRLDVARLPTEAAPLERKLFARGGYLDAHLGARGFLGDVGKVARPGPLLMVAGGYELASWVAVGAAFAGSIHGNDGQPPPGQTAFEALEALGQLRFTWPFRVQMALWLRAEGGMFASTGDVLRAYGFKRGDDFTGTVGGSLGFDWHVRGRHHSLGLEAGGRWLAGLARPAFSASVHGTAYIHYVF